MTKTARPRHQWFIGGLVIAFLLQPVIAWMVQLFTLLGECERGLGNRGLTGTLTLEHCVLNRRGRRFAEVPWNEDLWMTLMLVVVLACVVVALLLPRWSRWTHRLTLAAVPLLTFAGLSMAGRGFQRMHGALADMIVRRPVIRLGHERVADGWVINLARRDLWMPDVGGLALGSAFFAGLALLVLVSALLADRQQHRETSGGWTLPRP